MQEESSAPSLAPPVPPYEEDLRQLLNDYTEKIVAQDSSPTFAAFKDMWKDRSFSFIHECPPKHLDSARCAHQNACVSSLS